MSDISGSINPHDAKRAMKDLEKVMKRNDDKYMERKASKARKNARKAKQDKRELRAIRMEVNR